MIATMPAALQPLRCAPLTLRTSAHFASLRYPFLCFCKLWRAPSNPCVPRISALVRLQLVRHRHPRDVLHALVPDLPRHPQPQRPAECDRQLAPVHPVSQQRLRMHRVRHVDAVDPIPLKRAVDYILRLRQRPRLLQRIRKRRSNPLRNVRPALFALNHRDVAVPRHALDLVHRKLAGPRDQSVDLQPPVRESRFLMSREVVAQRGHFVRERLRGNLAPREFARQGVLRQHPVRRVRHRFAGAIDAARIRRHQPVVTGQLCRHRQSRSARGSRQASGNPFSACQFFHIHSIGSAPRPVIIARIRLPNPAKITMNTCTSRKSVSRIVAAKCSVLADCWPPSTPTAFGNAETNPGDIARPVHTISGVKTKITSKYVSRCSTLYDHASSAPGRLNRRCSRKEAASRFGEISVKDRSRFRRKCPPKNPTIIYGKPVSTSSHAD